jgi:DNA-directed RNA polymerase subunit H (RpoH/RPB5)
MKRFEAGLHDYFNNDSEGKKILDEIVETNDLPEIKKIDEVITRFKKIFI